MVNDKKKLKKTYMYLKSKNTKADKFAMLVKQRKSVMLEYIKL